MFKFALVKNDSQFKENEYTYFWTEMSNSIRENYFQYLRSLQAVKNTIVIYIPYKAIVLSYEKGRLFISWAI